LYILKVIDTVALVTYYRITKACVLGLLLLLLILKPTGVASGVDISN